MTFPINIRKARDIYAEDQSVKTFGHTYAGAAGEKAHKNTEDVGDALKFVKENEMVKMLSHNGQVFSVEPPLFVELEVTQTEPGFKGDTSTGATKPAVVETGAQVNVPLFVEIGDVIKIDTRTGEYLSRV